VNDTDRAKVSETTTALNTWMHGVLAGQGRPDYRDPVTPAEREAFLRTAHPTGRKQRPAMSKTAQRTRGLIPQKPPTPREREVIDALRWLAVKGGYVRAHEVGERTGQTGQGAATVLASCVRKGLVKRAHGRGHVWFRLTDRGWNLATPRTTQYRRGRPKRS